MKLGQLEKKSGPHTCWSQKGVRISITYRPAKHVRPHLTISRLHVQMWQNWTQQTKQEVVQIIWHKY